jgi:hypothetical protein
LNTIARARAAIEEWSHKDILDAGSKAQLDLNQTNYSEMPDRRFPPPWSVDDPNMKLGQDCYIVRDANGYPLAYGYFEDEPGRRSAAHLMTRDEARRIAVNIAKLPELLTVPRT